MLLTRRGALSGALLLAGVCPAYAQAGGPVVAAAADLNAVLPEVAELFRRQTGASVRLTFGSSGNMTQQILHGAPFEVFLSADEAYVHRLMQAGRTQGAGTLYATGRIGLFLPPRSGIRADDGLRDIAAAARDGRLRRFAIANPDHAPYGRAAREALQSFGVWDLVQPTLVLGENAAQATQFAMSGSAQGGVIPLSLALTPQVARAGAFNLIPEGRHAPLRQRMILIRGATATAEDFYRFLQSPAARAILQRYGFVVPAQAS